MSGSQGVRRLVVKVGSGVLAPGGRLDAPAMARLCDDLASARRTGIELILVSSGAVASGFRALGLRSMPRSVREKQASAAVGQPALMRAYSDLLGARGVTVAQVLLTADDFEHRERFLNARHTLETLLAAGVVPIVNENDSVVFDEIRLGDNDRLSALVASAMGVDVLVLLSVAPGLIDRTTGRVVPVVNNLSDAERYLDKTGVSDVGTGGMRTKLQAAGIVMSHGIPAVLAGGPSTEIPDPIARVLRDEPLGTRFEPAGPETHGGGLRARKSWIAFASTPRGELIVDEGAARAITQRGASLLPGGIVRVVGEFSAGAGVSILDAEGRSIARGLTSYSAAEIERIRGRRSDEIASVLGYAYADEVVHRDDLQLTGGQA